MTRKLFTLAICFLSFAVFAQTGKGKPQGTSHARSAKTGQYVSKETAAKHPSTTVVEKQKPTTSKKPK